MKLATLLGALCFVAGVGHVSPAQAQAAAGGIDVSQQPLFTATGQPPLNMLVMGRDHKLYYEAYNDASDLDGDGVVDTTYKPDKIDYYGYFDSHRCYTYSSGDKEFTPAAVTANKKCSGAWSGDFLNYLTTSRMDALRKVLYGGYRAVDDSSKTVLERSHVPQDAHSWGKEYTSAAVNGYDITQYAPLAAPASGKRILFANTSVRSDEAWGPRLRVLQNSPYRIWEWVSIERPVAGDKCQHGANGPLCVGNGASLPHPGHPANRAAFDTLETTYAIAANQYGGTFTKDRIDCNSSSCNLGSANQDNYLTIITGSIKIKNAGNYQFRINGDDAVDFALYNAAGTLVASSGCYGSRGFGACSGAEIATANNLAAGTYTFKLRQEDGTGGDGYKLDWRRTKNADGGGGTANPNFDWRVLLKDGSDPGANSNGGYAGDVSLRFYNLTPPDPNASTMTDFRVRTEVCKAPTYEANCKEYPNGKYKPTGILHDYGETDRMFFGLLTGSYAKNTQGGTLRSNIASFAREIDAATGIYKPTVTDGIVYTINHLRTIEFGTDYTYSCGWIGDRPVNDGECSMWGNPISEMMYETLRYFAGATAPRPEFDIGTGAKDANAPLSLAKPAWKPPFKSVANGGGGHLACSVPVMTVVSDINPSYDFSVPGTKWGSFSGSSDPAPLTALNVSTEVDAIWNAEGGGSRTVFVGESNGVADSAPTAKTVSNLSTVRGLAPEEPSKQGTYYSAGVARFGATHKIGGDKEAQTYSVALASPLPRIDFPVGNGRVTLVPFAKSVGGAFNISPTANFQPTNQIVDFYVQKIANTGAGNTDVTVNGGRPYAEFRINYEDVEQGADHDMDAIALYTLSVDIAGKLNVEIKSEYAAGSIEQHMGYVVSGTTQDGIYLEVCDLGDNKTNDGTRSSCQAQTAYKLNTPPGRPSGWCVTNLANSECKGLPPTANRAFTAGATAGAGLLKDPLWYAAKYGVPAGIPSTDAQGNPLNYFLVTNANNLKSQLDNAFANIIANSQPTASVATSTPRYVDGATLAYEASYTSEDWSGDLKAYSLRTDATYTGAPPVWSASSKIPASTVRKVFTGKPQGSGFTGVAFTTTDLDSSLKTRVQGGLDSSVYANDDLIAYLRGDQSKEQGASGCITTTDCPFRKRGSKMGDVLNSTPAVVGVSSFGYGSILATVAPTAAASYADFVQSKKSVYGNTSQNPVIFVGANDGMLHAIDGSDGNTGGKELFAYIPNAVLDNLHELATPGYTHRYFVDGSPGVGDAYLGAWKTVLVGSVGAGGRGIYALDITDPYNFGTSKVLWEFSSSDDADMGQFVGRPYMGLTEDGNWVAAFGNGYNSDRHSAVLFIRNLATGAEIAKLDTGVGCPSTERGCTTGPNGLATAVIVDNDGNGAGDTIYAGDYLGNVWRFEYVAGSWSIGNSGVPIFKATDPGGKPQAITSGVYTVANPLGGTMVVFGTGRYLNADDADETRIGQGTRASVDSVYGIWDSRMWDNENNVWLDAMPIAARSGANYVDLEKQSITGYTPLASDGTGGYWQATRNPVDFRTTSGGPGKMGWYIDLACTGCSGADPLAGARVTATPQGVLSDVLFNTLRPEGDSCEPGSRNATLVFDALTGAASYVPIAPPAGWPSGQEPPPGVVGTDTGKGPPPGEPPIVIITPKQVSLPPLCNPDDPGSCEPVPPCDPEDPSCEAPVKTCSWRSPNAAGRPAGKLIPCGRISWKQLR
ncbi:MAG: hypothetical protein GXC76_06850 [Rhodanobacteraceae bacterium]|nr:hypothetical protein [Rhodanobacteraceae bacterium]